MNKEITTEEIINIVKDRLDELKEMFLEKGYTDKEVDDLIKKSSKEWLEEQKIILECVEIIENYKKQLFEKGYSEEEVNAQVSKLNEKMEKTLNQGE
jgi:hypothetical protein